MTRSVKTRNNKVLLLDNGHVMYSEECCCDDPCPCACGAGINDCANCPTYKVTGTLTCPGGSETMTATLLRGTFTEPTDISEAWMPEMTTGTENVCSYAGQDPAQPNFWAFLLCCDGCWLIAVRRWSAGAYSHLAVMKNQNCGASPVGTYTDFQKGWDFSTWPDYNYGPPWAPTCDMPTFGSVSIPDEGSTACTWEVKVEVVDIQCCPISKKFNTITSADIVRYHTTLAPDAALCVHMVDDSTTRTGAKVADSWYFNWEWPHEEFFEGGTFGNVTTLYMSGSQFWLETGNYVVGDDIPTSFHSGYAYCHTPIRCDTLTVTSEGKLTGTVTCSPSSDGGGAGPGACTHEITFG